MTTAEFKLVYAEVRREMLGADPDPCSHLDAWDEAYREQTGAYPTFSRLYRASLMALLATRRYEPV